MTFEAQRYFTVPDVLYKQEESLESRFDAQRQSSSSITRTEHVAGNEWRAEMVVISEDNTAFAREAVNLDTD